MKSTAKDTAEEPIAESIHARPGLIRAQAANALSVLRFAAAAGWIVAWRAGAGAALLSIALAAAASDFIDGRVARSAGSDSRFGGWLDATADITFILAAMASAAITGNLPAYVPALVAMLFAQYAIDSVLRRGRPIASRLGHLCGIANYALVLALAAEPIVQGARVVIDYAAPLMAIFYLAAMGERIRGYIR